MTTVSQVVDQMVAHGMPQLPANHPVLDGKYKRFGPEKKAWYILREMTLKSGKNIVTGAFGIFQGENRNTVSVSLDFENLSDEDRAEFSRKQKHVEEKEAQRIQMAADLASNRAKDQWSRAENGNPDLHPYLLRKGTTAENVRVSDHGVLLVPMKHYSLAGARLVGLQKIASDGTKLYNKGMEKVGAACLLGSIVGAPIIGIGEGYATCRSVRMALGPADIPVMVAFDAGNILPVALGLRRDFPLAHLLFLADDDYQLEKRFTEGLSRDFKITLPVAIDGQTHDVLTDNGDTVQVFAVWRTDPQGIEYIEADARLGRTFRNYKYENAGVSRCHAAAKSVCNASVVAPSFSNRGDNKWTDFNDLHIEESLTAVALQIGLSITAAQQPIKTPALSDERAVVDDQFGVSSFSAQQPFESPAPSGEGAETTDFAHAAFDIPLPESPPPPDAKAAAAGLSPEGEGESHKKREKSKKIYDPDHWDQVAYVLDNFILIYGEDLVWDESQRMLMKISSMRTIVQNSDVMKFWGGDARKWVLKKNIVFDPLERPSPALSGSTATVNLFSGWKMKPKKGAYLQIEVLLLHLCNGDETLMMWVMRWLAYPLRNRGAKMETSIIMHGDEGSGKNFFFEKVVKEIYGEYGYVIGNAQLESQFNDWAGMKLFMVCDEVVTRSELKHMKGKLKGLVTGDTVIINPKGLPEHSEANHMNFVFLSNELQPLALDKTDRRYLVIWTPPALPKEFYADVAREIEAGGIEAFYHYLMYDLDMENFDKHTKPLYTDAKDSLIEKSLSPPERFYRDWSAGFLPIPFISCGVGQLYDAYKVWCEKSGEPKYISLTLFSPTVARYAGDLLQRRVIKYEYGNVVKQRYVFLTGNQPEGKSLSDWIADASALFEEHFKSYRSRTVSNVDT
ncbi:DUF5906 domain-containing protein [Glaciimonas sp. GNP009]